MIKCVKRMKVKKKKQFSNLCLYDNFNTFIALLASFRLKTFLLSFACQIHMRGEARDKLGDRERERKKCANFSSTKRYKISEAH